MQPESIEDSVETLRPVEDSSVPSTPTEHGATDDHRLLRSPPLSPNDGRSAFDTASEWSRSSVGDRDSSPGSETSGLTVSQSGAGSPIFDGRIYDTLTTNVSSSSLEDVSSRSRDTHLDGSDLPSGLYALPEEILFHIISHLPAAELLIMKLVSRRFFRMVNSPHAWMHAFSRFFPGPETLRSSADSIDDGTNIGREITSQRRAFTRLSSRSSWSGEYLRRTKLLRCLQRGKPALPFAGSLPGRPNRGIATMTFATRVGSEVSHLHADWGSAMDKRKPFFVHGLDARGTVTSSDRKGKFDSWGITGPTNFRTFASLYPGHSPWGLATADVIGLPNMMDLSQSHGMVYGEGIPNGTVSFLGSDAKRSVQLQPFTNSSFSDLGIPRMSQETATPCSLWIAKTAAVPINSHGALGLIVGMSNGVVSSYSLGGSSAKVSQKFDRGELTCRWLLSPGVPVICVLADDDLSQARLKQGRIWAVALNALGEVFILRRMPKVDSSPTMTGSDEEIENARERRAWQYGNAHPWELIPNTRRKSKYAGVFDDLRPPYLPDHFWMDNNRLEPTDNQQQGHRLERWMKQSAAEMKVDFIGWDMRRRLEVDFGNETSGHAGESIFIIHTGEDENSIASVARFVRCVLSLATSGPTEEWRSSILSLGAQHTAELTTSAFDDSSLARHTLSEDEELLGMANAEGRAPRESRNLSSDLEAKSISSSLPGKRARFFAVGTSSGSIIVWDARSSIPATSNLISTVRPLRIIYTESPAISSIALTALYLVHGGNEGLVQAWDPLGSTLEPLRTISSRKTINNRRRLVVAARQNPLLWSEMSASRFAATKICLDPDSTVLRGVAAIGAGWLRYWSYSSNVASEELNKSGKRKTKRGAKEYPTTNEETFTRSRRSGWKGVVDEELRFRRLDAKSSRQEEREERRLAGRFGLDLLGEGATEEEMLAYAKLLSQEEESKRSLQEARSSLMRNASESDVKAFMDTLDDEQYEQWKYSSWDKRFDLSASGTGTNLASPMVQTPSSPRNPVTEEHDLATAIEMSLRSTQRSDQSWPGPSTHDQILDADLLQAMENSLLDPAIEVPSSRTYPTPPSRRMSKTPSLVQQRREEQELAEAIRLSLQDNSLDQGTPSDDLRRVSSEDGRDRDSDEFPSLGSPGSASGAGGKSSAWGKGKGRLF